jgi:hypothetical protein
VSPETELDRLALVLKEMKAEDRRHEDQVAKLDLTVENEQEKVTKLEKAQAARKEQIDALNAAFKAATGPTVVYKGKEYPRDDVGAQLKIDARRYLDGQAILMATKGSLRSKREALTQARARFAELRVARERTQARLDQLRNALAEERGAPVPGEATEDHTARFKKDLEALQDRIKLMQKRRELRAAPGEGPIERPEAAEKKDAEVDAFLRSLNSPRAKGDKSKR